MWRTDRICARNASELGSAGRGVRILAGAEITAPHRIEVGDNVHIGTGAFIRAEGGLKIGDHTHISRNLLLYTMNHDVEGEWLPYGAAIIAKPVVIGRNVWIGMNVCIAPGTTIGDGAIIGMGTVVAGTVPPMAIVASQPWRTIGHRDAAHYEELDQLGRHRGASGQLFDN